MRSTTYTYPNSGRVRHSVAIASDGSIVVKQNDMLSKYSIAIHGRGDWTFEYARKKNNRFIPIANADAIKAGETIYHLPTVERFKSRQQTRNVMDFSDGPAFVVKSSFATNDQKQIQAAQEYLRDGLNLPSTIWEQLPRVFSAGNYSAAGLRAICWETINVFIYEVGVNGLLGIIGHVAAPFIALGGSIVQLIRALDVRNIVASSIGYCYGMTAWAFGSNAIPNYSKRLRHLYRNVPRDEFKETETRWVLGAHAGYLEGEKAVRKKRIDGKRVSRDAYRFYLRLIARNNPIEFTKKIARGTAKQISSDIARSAFLNAVEHSGCVYNR